MDLLLRFCLLFVSALILTTHLSCVPPVLAQDTSKAPVAQPKASPAQQTAAEKAKAAERKKRFEALEQALESGNSDRTEQSAGSAVSASKFSPNDLSLSPIMVNMLVGQTQSFSLFDYAGNKLTSQADWTVSDSSIAELTIVNGEPELLSKQTGTVSVRARVDARSAEATVHVITPEEMKPGTVRWQAPTRPGSKTLQVVPAVPSGGGSPPL